MLGRTEIDMQASGPQGVTVEDTFSMVHISHGQLRPRSPHLRSGLGSSPAWPGRPLGKQPIDWEYAVADYGRIRSMIADVIPGFTDFNERLQHPGGFHRATTPPTVPAHGHWQGALQPAPAAGATGECQGAGAW